MPYDNGCPSYTIDIYTYLNVFAEPGLLSTPLFITVAI